MKCVYLAPSELRRYERNARAHGEEDISAIKESIKSFGFNDPVGIWGENNIIVEGHGRVTAALQLGLEKIPCIRLDWMTDEQRRAYALAHNKTAELSGWDFETLDEELESKSKGKRLWLRNNASTILCNCAENFGFITLAFIGIYDWETILTIAISTSIIEAIVAVCDTPFLYVAGMINKKP